MPKGYKPEVIQRIELVLARYGSSANLGKYEERETIAEEIWKSVLQIMGKVSAEDCMITYVNEGDDIEYNYNSFKRNMDRYLALKKATKDANEKVKQPGYFGDEEE
jgi:hypothetical protein